MSDENGDAHVSCANVSPNVFQDLHHTRRNPERLSKQRFFWVEPFLPQTDPRWWPGLEGAGVYPASVACQGTLIGLILRLCPRASFCLTLAFGFLLFCRRRKNLENVICSVSSDLEFQALARVTDEVTRENIHQAIVSPKWGQAAAGDEEVSAPSRGPATNLLCTSLGVMSPRLDLRTRKDVVVPVNMLNITIGISKYN